MDLAGPFPESTAGNKYLLVVNDCYTRWVECYPLKNMEAKTVAEAFVTNFVSRYGVPLVVHSDQGRQFESELFQEMCSLLDIKKTRTSPFHPAGNAVSERSIKTIVNLISTSCRQQKEWDKDLPLLTMAYRSTPHESTGYTPNYLLFGREITMPVDLQIGLSPPYEKLPKDEYVKQLRERLQTAHQSVRESLKSAAKRNKRYYDIHCRTHKYQKGDVIYKVEKNKKKGQCPKLQPRWRGPFLISQVFSDVLFEIQIAVDKFATVHHDLLKPCYAEQLPKWLRKARKRLV